MFDPFGNMQNMMGQFRQFMGNPIQFMAQRKLNIPQQYLNDPQGAIQHLMNNGVINQEQYNWVNKTAQMIQQNPMFHQFMNRR